MPDWKIEQDYAFTGELDEAGWAWEFLRRNPEYQKDYDLAHAEMSQHKGSEWMHAASGGDEPVTWKMGRRWRISGPIRDPKDNNPPLFVAVYPREPQYDDIGDFFGSVADEGASAPQVSEFATLVFDLRRQIAPQIERARERLTQRQALISVQKAPHKGSEKWPLYLRLLDAKNAGASTDEILGTIKSYAHLGNDAADGYAAAKAVASNLEAAKSLVERALAILK